MKGIGQWLKGFLESEEMKRWLNRVDSQDR